MDTKKYGRLKTELNDSYVAGHNNYPHMLESAVTMLSRYMNVTNVQPTNENEGQQVLTSFAQQRKNVTCYKCGKKGYDSNECPDREKDDTSSIGTNQSQSSNKEARVAWSG